MSGDLTIGAHRNYVVHSGDAVVMDGNGPSVGLTRQIMGSVVLSRTRDLAF